MATNGKEQPDQLPVKQTKSALPSKAQRKLDEVNESLRLIDAQKLYTLMNLEQEVDKS